MKNLSTYFFIIFLAIRVTGQTFSSTDPDYTMYVQAGEKALKAMEYDSCIYYYQKGFKIKQTSYLSTLRNAACAHSKGSYDYRDEQLKIAFEINWGGSKQIYNDYDEFKYLRGTDFDNLIQELYERSAKASGVNLEMMEEFETLRYEDQRYRQQMRNYENGSPQMDSLWGLQSKADSKNTERIIEVIEEHGYPGKSMVGPGHASTAFLIIQHADLEIQQKYLTLITNAADAGEVQWSSVALLLDRVRMREGKSQIYGSQLTGHPSQEGYVFHEIENPYQIDSIRASVGLGTISEYAKFLS
ncbi:MAG: hypothetical protein P8M34_08565 [Saprospiraceae bacterium]|nr:hypothetical protein [Saprospiraceae bacterium]|tara:strand:- start:11753 stop:12652 length:900 start_codon:yes stop_codon:yes gene_type:complete